MKAEKIYNINGSDNLYTNSVYKKLFSTENKKSGNFNDLLRYCMYLISYREIITIRKLKNHFYESTINYALDKKVLVPYDLNYVKDEKDIEKYKNALFFTYFNYCRKHNLGTWQCRKAPTRNSEKKPVDTEKYWKDFFSGYDFSSEE